MTVASSVLGLQGFAAAASLVDAYSSVSQFIIDKELTYGGAFDILADLGELMSLFRGFDDFDQTAATADQLTVCMFILWGTLDVIHSLELFTGQGAPDVGLEFVKRAFLVNGVDDLWQESRHDDAHWRGSGARAYDGQVQLLSALAQSMQEADWQIADILQRQAGHVDQARTVLAATRMTLIGLVLLLQAIMGAFAGYVEAYVERDMALQTGAGATVVYNVVDDNLGSARPVGLPISDRRAARRQILAAEFPFFPVADAGIIAIYSYLPYIVLPPCIVALITARTVMHGLVGAGERTANDMHEHLAAYDAVTTSAASVCATSPWTDLARLGTGRRRTAGYLVVG